MRCDRLNDPTFAEKKKAAFGRIGRGINLVEKCYADGIDTQGSTVADELQETFDPEGQLNIAEILHVARETLFHLEEDHPGVKTQGQAEQCTQLKERRAASVCTAKETSTDARPDLQVSDHMHAQPGVHALATESHQAPDQATANVTASHNQPDQATAEVTVSHQQPAAGVHLTAERHEAEHQGPTPAQADLEKAIEDQGASQCDTCGEEVMNH